MSITAITLAVVAAAQGIYVLVGYIRRVSHQRSISQSKGCRELRQVPEFQRLPLGFSYLQHAYREKQLHRLPQFHHEVFTKIGHTWELRAGGFLMSPTLFTNDPRVMEAVLATQFSEFGVYPLRVEKGYEFLGNGIFLVDGKDWMHQRALLRPQFSKSQVMDSTIQEKHVRKLLDVFLPPDANQNTLEAHKVFLDYAMDSSTEFLFGESSGVLDQHLGGPITPGGAFAEAFRAALEGKSVTNTFGRYLGRLLLNNRQFYQAIKTCHAFIDAYVEKALESAHERCVRNDRYVFLDELAKLTQDRKTLRYQALNIIFAARDTTGTALSWIIRALARKPEVFQKLREEVIKVCGEGNKSSAITYNQLRKIDYLQWVIKEVLRLYPLVPLNGKAALVDTTLPIGGGPDATAPIFVEKGETIIYSTYSMQRRKDLYGNDANKFRPERWGEEKARKIGWAYLPFNNGPRVCIGQERALNEIFYMLARLVQHCKGLELREIGDSGSDSSIFEDEEESFKADLRLVMNPTGGVWIRATKAGS